MKVLLVTVAIALGMMSGPATPAYAESCQSHLEKHGIGNAAADAAYHALLVAVHPVRGS